MTRLFLIVISLLFFSSVYSQDEEWIPAKVVLKNGTSFRGLVKLPTDSRTNLSSQGKLSIKTNKVLYKKNKKSEKVRYGSDTIEEIVFGDEQYVAEYYKYVPISKSKLILMERVLSGKVELYRIDNKYYLLRKGEEKVLQIVDSFNVFHPSRAKEYFADCDKIVYYLENDLYSLDNLYELVDDYNLLCN